MDNKKTTTTDDMIPMGLAKLMETLEQISELYQKDIEEYLSRHQEDVEKELTSFKNRLECLFLDHLNPAEIAELEKGTIDNEQWMQTMKLLLEKQIGFSIIAEVTAKLLQQIDPDLILDTLKEVALEHKSSEDMRPVTNKFYDYCSNALVTNNINEQILKLIRDIIEDDGMEGTPPKSFQA